MSDDKPIDKELEAKLSLVRALLQELSEDEDLNKQLSDYLGTIISSTSIYSFEAGIKYALENYAELTKDVQND